MVALFHGGSFMPLTWSGFSMMHAMTGPTSCTIMASPTGSGTLMHFRHHSFVMIGSAFLISSLLSSCATSLSQQCVERAKGISAQKPCWVIDKPSEGIVLKGSRSSWSDDGWFKAQQKLFNQAVAMFAQQKIGSEVTLSAVVESSTSVTSTGAEAGSREQVHTRTEVQNTTEITQSDDSVQVQVTLEDYYYYPPTDTAYIWAIEQ